MVADTLLLFEPSIRANPEHVVVGKSGATECSGKNHFLLWRRVKPKTVCALDFHLHIVYSLCERVK